jgi:hypothetical protein
VRFRLAVLSKQPPHEREETERELKAGKTMQQLFPPRRLQPGEEEPKVNGYPRVLLPEAHIAIATRSRLARDQNGRVLSTEAHTVLDREGVTDELVRELWLDLWAAADEETAAIQAEELEAARPPR